MFLNNRYYDPTLGAFTSVDPLVGKTGTPYLYAGGNPTTLSDPSGLCACSRRDGGGGGYSPLPRGEWVSPEEISWALSSPDFYSFYAQAMGDIAIGAYEHVDRSDLPDYLVGVSDIAAWMAENDVRAAYRDGTLREAADYLVPARVGQDPQALQEWLAYAQTSMDECILAGDCDVSSGDWLTEAIAEISLSAGMSFGSFKNIGGGSSFSTYHDVTKKGSKYINIATSATAAEAEETLVANGFERFELQGGGTKFTKGITTYTLYASSSGPATLSVNSGSAYFVIRLGQ